MKHIFFWLFIVITFFASPFSFSNSAPDVQLAKVYEQQKPVSEYLVSEKYDGVRAIWDGKQLKTRTGRIIHAPKWFTAVLPNRWLDGELWAGYNNFAFVSSLVRRKVPDHDNWQQVHYLIFDAPDPMLTFEQRFQKYQGIVNGLHSIHIKPIPQYHFKTKAHLDDFYNQVLLRGGEGVMLHEKQATHQAGRTAQILKYKPKFDAEAIVMAHLPGKGKYQGMMGAITVKTMEGVTFNIGTGFTDELRKSPPPIGSTITFQYQGLTRYGKPRFASFLRIRGSL
ncbi:DNA ligase [Pseudoalteromonas luteoviolacea]|uniref:DNA ligase n=1 Tax=Pseudoalteromonas luteoviolacea TaxID=43657 RepID=A0A0C1Q597_9GAMM|nr:DNA ligase [Pseudoalteromonas luteoviolacea]KID54665.1 DNA ligase [Pseudoalteromonas luteoviolacea]